MEASQRRTHLLGYSACALAGSIWGTGFYFGRIALNEMPVDAMVLLRFLFACLVMLPVALLHWRSLRLTAAEWRALLFSAALGIPVQFLIQFHGLARTTVSHASLMVGAFPVMLAAAASVFAGERLDRVGWTALFASTLGAALITLGAGRGRVAQGQPTLVGDLMVLASLGTALVWVLLSKKLMDNHSPVVVSALTLLTGTAMLALWSALPTSAPLPNLTRISPTAWGALAISGLLCTAATTFLWNWGIHHVPASRAGVFLNLEPAIGSWLGVQFLGEHLGPHAWLGGALILGAAVTLTARQHPPEPEILLE